MGFVKRAEKVDKCASDGKGPADAKFSIGYPALWEYLTLEAWEDGRPRETSTLLLMVEEGLWKACLNDRAQDRSLWVSGHSIDACVASLDDRLTSDSGEWRRRNPAPAKKKR